MLLTKKIISETTETIEVKLPVYFKSDSRFLPEYYAITEEGKVVSMCEMSIMHSHIWSADDIINKAGLLPISEDEFFQKFNTVADSFKTVLIPVTI